MECVCVRACVRACMRACARVHKGRRIKRPSQEELYAIFSKNADVPTLSSCSFLLIDVSHLVVCVCVCARARGCSQSAQTSKPVCQRQRDPRHVPEEQRGGQL
jgi:hypothetical protein